MDPFGKPEHTGHGQHQIEDILPHAKGGPGKKKNRNTVTQESSRRKRTSGGCKTEKGGRRGKTGGGGILCFGQHIQIHDKEQNAAYCQGGLPECIRTSVAMPQLHALVIDHIKA